jgi:general secretion pathway protein H
MGLMLALAGPRITSGLASVTLKSTARKIATTLRYSRGQAVAIKTPHEVFFDNEEGVYGIEKRAFRRDQKSLLKQFKLPEEIKLEKKNIITFYPNGSSSGGKVIITNRKGKSYLIGVDIITGLVRTSRDEGTGD